MHGSQTIVEALKEKLWKKTGTAVASTRLELRDETGAMVADLDRDAAPLAA
jgi:tubulin-folding cofactor B